MSIDITFCLVMVRLRDVDAEFWDVSKPSGAEREVLRTKPRVSN